MPRPRAPPTPASSTDIKAQDGFSQSDMEVAFSLPPAVMESTSRRVSQNSPPALPRDGLTDRPSDETSEKTTGLGLSRKRTLSGAATSKTGLASQLQLPPPPSRARKIIQMKPKQSVSPTETPAVSAATPSVSSSSSISSSIKTQNTAAPKRKQPSATSAAGRKNARKTAHSIIERRRRSKMNEEFGVLKGMIPACDGVEMHKLAILQAGIEYMQYLEGCVEKLQRQRQQNRPEGEEQDLAVEDGNEGMSERPTRRVTTLVEDPCSSRRRSERGDSVATVTTTSTFPSPSLGPVPSASPNVSQARLPSVTTSVLHTPCTTRPPLSASVSTSTGVSPVFDAIHFSSEFSRTPNLSSSHSLHCSAHPSPNILPLPQVALPLANGHGEDGQAEANATAALMMLTHDRRGGARGGGMSVKDLLSG